MATTTHPKTGIKKVDDGDLNWNTHLQQNADRLELILPIKLSSDNSYTPLVSAAAFSGSGLDDATAGGTFVGARDKRYLVVIDGEGTPDTFKWSDDGGVTFTGGVAITGAAQTLNEGVTVTFGATTGHTAGDQWAFYGKAGDPQNPNDIDGADNELTPELPGQLYLAELDNAYWVARSATIWDPLTPVLGTDAGKPKLAPNGQTYRASDTKRVYRGNGFIWEEALGQFVNASLPASPIAGRLILDTERLQLLLGNGTADPSFVRTAERGFINGLELTWDSATTMTLSVGAARDSTDVVTGRLGSSMQKALSAGAWSAGAAGVMNEGAVPTDTWLHVFLLVKGDGSADWGVDSSTTAANLKAGGAAAYDFHRRVGSIYINFSSEISRFIQSGDEFWWYDRNSVDADISLDDTPADLTLMVPPDYRVVAHLNVHSNAGGEHTARVYSKDTADRAISTTGSAAVPNQGGSGNTTGGFVDVLTNTARQVRAVADRSLSQFQVIAYGWRDERARNFS